MYHSMREVVKKALNVSLLDYILTDVTFQYFHSICSINKEFCSTKEVLCFLQADSELFCNNKPKNK